MKRRYADKPNLDWNTWHIARKGDSVPRLPPPPLYQHVGREFTSSEDGVIREIADPPYLFSFLNVYYDVRVILNNGAFNLETERRKHTPDGLMARRIAEKLSFVSYVPSPWNNIVNIVVVIIVITGVFCYYVRAMITGFFKHAKELYYRTVGSRPDTVAPATKRQNSKPGPAPAPWPGGKLIDLNDGQYKPWGFGKAMKVSGFEHWREERAVSDLTAEKSEEINGRARGSFLDTGHVLVAWSRGQDIFLERFKGDDYWIWPYTNSGSQDQAIEEVKQLLQQPLDDAASRETDMRAPTAPSVKPTSISPATG